MNQPLETKVVGSGDGPVVVAIHGYGAPPDDLVPLAQALRLPADTRFVFPAGPLSAEFGRAFWPLPSGVQRMLETGRGLRDLSQSVPPGMPEARARMLATLDQTQAEWSLPSSQLALGGFSQGAMLALDVTLFSDEPPRAVYLLSGTLVAEAEWVPRMDKLKNVPVFVSHGRQDPLLPFEMADKLRERLVQAGANVTWVPFTGGHEIPPDVLERLRQFLLQHLHEKR